MENSQTSGVLDDDGRFRDLAYDRVKEYRDAHGIMTSWFSKMRFLLMIPSTLITALTSMISFINASDEFFNEADKNKLNYAIGVITIISTALQSYQAACAVEQKIKAHHVATGAFRDLGVQIKFDPNIDLTLIDDRIVEASQKCQYDIPLWVWKRIKRLKKNRKPLPTYEPKSPTNASKEENTTPTNESDNNNDEEVVSVEITGDTDIS